MCGARVAADQSELHPPLSESPPPPPKPPRRSRDNVPSHQPPHSESLQLESVLRPKEGQPDHSGQSGAGREAKGEDEVDGREGGGGREREGGGESERARARRGRGREIERQRPISRCSGPSQLIASYCIVLQLIAGQSRRYMRAAMSATSQSTPSARPAPVTALHSCSAWIIISIIYFIIIYVV